MARMQAAKKAHTAVCMILMAASGIGRVIIIRAGGDRVEDQLHGPEDRSAVCADSRGFEIPRTLRCALPGAIPEKAGGCGGSHPVRRELDDATVGLLVEPAALAYRGRRIHLHRRG